MVTGKVRGRLTRDGGSFRLVVRDVQPDRTLSRFEKVDSSETAVFNGPIPGSIEGVREEKKKRRRE